jgi:LmbE family N-acetylglucosaminyl deacetylase
MASRTVIVIAAHPDDEVLGAGGTLLRHTLDGDVVHAFVVCEGESLRYEGRPVGLATHMRAAADILRFASITPLGFPDQSLDVTPLTKLTATFEAHFARLQPHIIYTHYWGDLNRDHRAIAEAVVVAARPTDRNVEEILGFETPSSTEWTVPNHFQPQQFVDISRTLDDKLRAMACYTSETRAFPHPRSLEHLRQRAAYWGGVAMMEAAEPFMVFRRFRR